MPNSAGEFSRIDLAIVIDNSGSMDADWSPKNDPNRIRHTVAKDLIDKLGNNDRVCVVNFGTSAVLQTSFTSDKQAAKNAVDTFINGGSTALYSAVNVANNQFATNSDDSARKIMIVLTDGMDNASTVSLATVTQRAVQNNVIIYTIGLGSQLDLNALTSLAQTTGGQYYHASKADELAEIFKTIAEEDIQVDTDGDGLPDYYENLINEGKLRLGNGVTLRDPIIFPGAVELKIDVEDSDGDGWADGDEIKVWFKENPDGTIDKVYIYMYSNPCVVDTDYDGINDKDDPEPLFYNITDNTLALVSRLAYNNLKIKAGRIYNRRP